MGVLALGAIGSIVVPLWRTPRAAGLQSGESNLALWRQEREEILRDADNGVLSATERELALADLSERAARELGTTSMPRQQEREQARRPARVLALLLAAGMAVLSVLLYARLGTPEALSGSAQASAEAERGTLAVSDPRVLEMVQKLTKKLEANPDDAQGWLMLGRSQMVLAHYPEAARAYERAVKLSPPDAQTLADYADALAMAQGRRLDGEPTELVMQAVKLDPTNQKALELAGTVALGRGDIAGAIGYWEKLRAQLPPQSDDAREVDAALESLRGRLGQPGASSARGAAVGAAGPATAASPKTAQAVGAGGGGSAGSAGRVTGQIDVAGELAGKVTLSDTVFIFAKAAGGADASAPRMPLAVVRFAARELPRSFELGDAQAMTPAGKVSTQSEVVVQARISKSGSALPQPGDLESAPVTVKPGARPVSIVISRVVQ